MPLAIDVSNYTGPIEAVQAHAWRTAGVRRVVVGTQYPAPPFPAGCAHRQVPALLEAGVAVEAYVYLWLADDPARQVREALEVIGPWRERVGRLWIDVEDTSTPRLGPETREACVRRAVAACEAASMSTGIYTAAWFWREHMADTPVFAALPLWAAQYDGRADLEVPPFGGWSGAAMKQYAADVTFAGVPCVDLNWYVGDRDLPPPPLEEREFVAAFAALYRDVPAAGLPIGVRWGGASREADGTEVHRLLVRGRQMP